MIADDYDAINARLKALRPCPTAQALSVDIQWYMVEDTGLYYYRPTNERATSYFKAYCSNSFGFYPLVFDREWLRKHLTLPEDFVFEEVPNPQ